MIINLETERNGQLIIKTYNIPFDPNDTENLNRPIIIAEFNRGSDGFAAEFNLH